MTTFVENLERTLSSIKQTKEFLESTETLRAVALKRKKWHWDPSAEAVLIIGFLTLQPATLLVSKWGFPLLETSVVLGAVGVVWGVSGGVNVLLRKWKKNAARHGLGWGIETKEDFTNLNKTHNLSKQVEVIEECQRAGATADQLTRLYTETSEDLPCAWWDTLYDAAHRETKRLNAEHAEQDRRREQEELNRLAQEKIQAHLNTTIENTTIEVEQMGASNKEATKDELCSGIKL